MKFVDKIGNFLYNINIMDDRKLKVYLDTSVISYLKQDDAPDETKITLRLWEKFKTGIYSIYLSQVDFTEMDKCEEPKLSFLKEKLNEIDFEILEVKPSTQALAKEIINMGILTDKSFDDCIHIAVAIENECDIIVSWNFKHMVNIKTINGVRAITILKNQKNINILNPLTLLEMEV